MAKKPSYELTYTVDEVPPFAPGAVLALQHALLIATSFVFPLILIRSAGMDNADAAAFLSMTILAVGIGTILMSLKGTLLGSGFLCPSFAALFFIPPSMTAYSIGGIGLLSAMTAVSGAFQITMSRVINRLRVIFPPEVTGLVIIMAAISAIPFSVQSFLGIEGARNIFELHHLTIAIVTLGVIMIIMVWGKGSLTMFPVLIGIIAGYITSFLVGEIPVSLVFSLVEFPLFSVPRLACLSWSFDPALVFPFLIAGLAGIFKTIGNLTTCQKINDAQWIRSDMDNYSRGTLTDGITNVVCGVFGGLGQSTSSGNIGLSLATGATSRWIGIAAGSVIIATAFLPFISFFFMIMPVPVIGAVLIYSICFMVMTGIEVMMSRMMDTRRFFTIGFSFVFGLGASTFSVVTMPAEHTWAATLLTSPLTLSTLLAISLTLIFRIGIRQEERLSLRMDTPGLGEAVFSFVDRNARKWGARRDVATRAGAALFEFLDTGFATGIFQEDVTVTMLFDEYNLDLFIDYHGDLFTIPDRAPTKEELMEDPDAISRLALSMVRAHSDRLSVFEKNGVNRVQIHFEH